MCTHLRNIIKEITFFSFFVFFFFFFNYFYVDMNGLQIFQSNTFPFASYDFFYLWNLLSFCCFFNSNICYPSRLNPIVQLFHKTSLVLRRRLNTYILFFSFQHIDYYFCAGAYVHAIIEKKMLTNKTGGIFLFCFVLFYFISPPNYFYYYDFQDHVTEVSLALLSRPLCR